MVCSKTSHLLHNKLFMSFEMMMMMMMMMIIMIIMVIIIIMIIIMLTMIIIVIIKALIKMSIIKGKFFLDPGGYIVILAANYA